MKRDIHAALVCVLIFVAVCAGPVREAAAGPTFEFGLRGGLSMAKLTGDDTKGIIRLEDYDATISGDVDQYRMGFTGGVYLMVNVTEMFGVRLEALYAMKGGKGEVEGTVDYSGLEDVPFTADVTFKLAYIEIPLLAVLSIPVGETAKFNAMAGPAVSFKTSAELQIELAIMGYFIDQTEDIDEYVKGTDVGGVIGGGFSFEVGQVNLFVDGRWTFGFSSIDDSGEDIDVKNSALSFMAGVGIPFGAGE